MIVPLYPVAVVEAGASFMAGVYLQHTTSFKTPSLLSHGETMASSAMQHLDKSMHQIRSFVSAEQAVATHAVNAMSNWVHHGPVAVPQRGLSLK